MKTKNRVLYLPHELIIQILVRLPVKSLLRFKCVCKSWYSIISDTHFANSQFQLTAETHTRRALFISTVSPHETRSIDVEASLDDDSNSVSLNPVNFTPSGHFLIKGSCRGFILLLCYPSFYLWNPSTGLHKNIPLSPLCFNLVADLEYFYGFGYDQSTDDYLIVSMSSSTTSPYREFFSLRANTWKQIDEDITNIYYLNANHDSHQAGSLFNGAIHWFAYRPDLENIVIVFFDLIERKLSDMNLPEEHEHELQYCSLWEFRECLSLWSRDYNSDTIAIWVMKEYKLLSSWSKTHVLSIDVIPDYYFSPLCSTKSGDIVGNNVYSRLVKYNDEGHLLGRRRNCFNHTHGSRVVMYTESLLSLPRDNIQA